MTEGAQAPLLGQELLVRYWVDVRGEAEGRADEDGTKQSEGVIISEQITSDCRREESSTLMACGRLWPVVELGLSW